MATFSGGSYQVGTKDASMVYFDRYTGPDATGDLIVNMNITPEDARKIGQALIDQANAIEAAK